MHNIVGARVQDVLFIVQGRCQVKMEHLGQHLPENGQSQVRIPDLTGSSVPFSGLHLIDKKKRIRPCHLFRSLRGYHARLKVGVRLVKPVACDVGQLLRDSNCLDVPQKWDIL